MADEKKHLRRILRESRDALSPLRAAQLSALIQRRLIESPFYAGAATVVLYSALDNEVATDLIFADALASGRRVLFPRIVAQNHDLCLVRAGDRAELSPGALGILEPTGAEITRPDQLGQALICVPGVAFGLAGERLGRGGGYFDRLLAAIAPQAVTAGLAYSFQVLDRLPQSPHDRRLGLIATESRLYLAADALSAAAREAKDQGGIPRCC